GLGREEALEHLAQARVHLVALARGGRVLALVEEVEDRERRRVAASGAVGEREVARAELEERVVRGRRVGLPERVDGLARELLALGAGRALGELRAARAEVDPRGLVARVDLARFRQGERRLALEALLLPLGLLVLAEDPLRHLHVSEAEVV